MSDNEMVVEVLRLDAEATPGPWEHKPQWGDIFDESSDPPFSCRRGETRREDDGAAIVGADNVEVIYEGTFEPYEQTAGVLGAVPADAALIAYYRTAAPALAREAQRLQGEVDVLEGRAWECQGPRCYKTYPMTDEPVYGEYPEEGEHFCSQACLEDYNRLALEVEHD